MPQRLFANAGAQSTCASAITSAQTTVTLQSASGFPPVVSGQQFSVIILDSGNPAYNANSPLATPYEYQQVNAVSGNVLTFGPGGGAASRVAYAGTTPKAFFAGAVIAQATLADDINASFPIKIDEQTPSSGTSVTIPVPSWARKIQVDWVARTGAPSDTLQVQFNGDITGNYAYNRVALSNTYSNASANNQTSAQVAFIAGTNTIAGSFAGGTFELYTPNTSTRRRMWHNRTTRDDSAFGASGPGPEISGGNWNNTANAITSIVFFLSTGPYVSGCSFVSYAYP